MLKGTRNYVDAECLWCSALTLRWYETTVSFKNIPTSATFFFSFKVKCGFLVKVDFYYKVSLKPACQRFLEIKTRLKISIYLREPKS